MQLKCTESFSSAKYWPISYQISNRRPAGLATKYNVAQHKLESPSHVENYPTTDCMDNNFNTSALTRMFHGLRKTLYYNLPSVSAASITPSANVTPSTDVPVTIGRLQN